MKLIFHSLLFSLLAFTITSCDDEEPMMEACAKAVTFTVGTTEACATGTFNLANNSFTSINLAVDGGGSLVITVVGAAVQPFAIPAGNAVYTNADGTIYSSTAGGMLDVTDNADTMDATFSFDAESTDGATVSISSGVIVDLAKQ